MPVEGFREGAQRLEVFTLRFFEPGRAGHGAEQPFRMARDQVDGDEPAHGIAHDMGLRNAQVVHQPNHIQGRLFPVLLGGFRLVTAAMAAQVEANHPVGAAQGTHHARQPPVQVGVNTVPVHQDHGGSLPLHTIEKTDAPGIEILSRRPAQRETGQNRDKRKKRHKNDHYSINQGYHTNVSGLKNALRRPRYCPCPPSLLYKKKLRRYNPAWPSPAQCLTLL
ncbi:MAG: hypothetical protein BWX80_02682 [Candidatus Hydrogenedentes bacterium ADurb.Bin101]|nr:MAG: hypothetical protein BWX80_02682 [Candidatus Hydrogenedentes bacterium ADurb.Bin101]